MTNYSKFVSNKNASNVPVSEPLPNKNMVVGSAGGYVFKIDKWSKLDRFLILGVETATYYVSQKDMVVENAKNLQECIKEDGLRVVDTIVKVSEDGRAPRNDPALFALALCSSLGDPKTKEAAFKALPKVARIGTHLLTYVNYQNNLRGWGRGAKKSIANWFNSKTSASLAYQTVKYFNRNGWTLKDVLRLSHAKPKDSVHGDIFKYIVKGWDSVGSEPHSEESLRVIWAKERAKSVTDGKEIAKLVSEHKLPWEALDTKWLNDHDVWDALLKDIKPEALMRNLGRLTSNGFLKPLSSRNKIVVSKLTDEKSLIAHRLHPLKLLVALKTYKSGKGIKGDLTWTPVPQISDALEEAFYKSFSAVVPTGKRILFALDVSGSMRSPISGFPISSAEAAAALAMVTARVESDYAFIGFCERPVPLNITSKMSLDAVTSAVQKDNFGSTNPSAAIDWALANKVEFDAMVVITDNDVNSGTHVSAKLEEYRKKMKIPNAKMVVLATIASSYSVADPNDPLQLDCVGFDLSVPNVISDFISGKI